MPKILGLDLGTTSIGWALVHEKNDGLEIMAMGCRVIPLDKDESDEFSKGNKITKNQIRTARRTQRKRYYRYVLRRKALTEELKKHGMFDEKLFNLPQSILWGLRAKAVTEKIKLTELGRVLYHLNQKRGYKSAKVGEENEKETSAYVSEVKSRWQQLKEEGKTIGQKFFEELSKNPAYRTKQQVFPREAYIEEYNAIMQKQQKYYPDVLTKEWINHVRDNIIYFQRKLKSQKGLVNVCEFEGFFTQTKEGKKIFTGPKVAHRSNPIFQIERIWETINNISIKDKRNNEFPITLDQKKAIFDYLDNHEELSRSELFKILGIKEKSGWYGNKLISKGLKGNTTKALIRKALQNEKWENELLRFELKPVSKNGEAFLLEKSTGEVLQALPKEEISADFVNQPLYQLWHTMYAVTDVEECKNALIKKFRIDEQTAERLAQVDFSQVGYGNKSTKAIRKILPYLMRGYKYSDAASFAGYNHAFVLTKDQVLKKELIDKIPLLKKNALRQPVVEKILNQMIHIVNDIIDEKRGWVSRTERENGLFEIRIELARELKQSIEERKETFKNLNRIEQENKKIEEKLRELGVRPTRKNIIKYRLFNEISGKEKEKINATCVYTGKMFSLTDALNGDDIDVEHIIPRTLLFDDSQSNKTLTFRVVNQEKGNRTAYDYMASKGEEILKQYVERINELYKEKLISKTKRDKLLMPGDKIPQDMIERQVRETQYVARKAREILFQVSRNVWSTTGEVTARLRRLWGWDDVLMNLQLQRIKMFVPNPLQEGITEIITWDTDDGQQQKKEVIKDWTKRDDHRHHAIDALVVACTKQGFIQRINTLSAQHTREELYAEVSKQSPELREKLTLLEKYLVLQKPFTTREVQEKASEILISFKPGKKVATYGKRFIRKNGKRILVQKNIIVPRGPLSEESVYGKIKTIEKNKPVEYLFEHPQLIFKPYIRELVENRLQQHNGNIKEAIASLKKEPIYLDKAKKIKLTYATCFKEEYVIKYPVSALKAKDVPYIVDEKVRQLIEKRLAAYKNNEKEAFKEPVYFDKKNKIPIRTVRLFTGLSAVEKLRTDEEGNPISFVKPGNNHHLAIYRDEHGQYVLHLCTFWHAVERKKYGLPVIIHNPSDVWNKILNNTDGFSENFIEKIPRDRWSFVTTIQQNEMFLLTDKKLELDKEHDPHILSKYLYRVQKIFYNGKQLEIYFRYHTETILDDSNSARLIRRYYPVKSIGSLVNLNPVKVRTNRLGEIIEKVPVFN